MNSEISIAGRKIGAKYSPYIIAELSANHNGKLDKALETISAAKKSGAHAIKMQTYTPDTLTINCNNDDFLIKGGLWDGYKLYDLYKEAQTPYEWHKPIFDHAEKIGITCFSSPFDETAVDLLEDLNSPAYKIASFEAIDLPLIKYVASTRKPMIISTGMANLEEIEEAVQTATENGCSELALLHCISAYPAPMDQANLSTLSLLKKRFNVVVGLSDHTLGTLAGSVAAGLGASLIEKHFILDRRDKGADSEFSIEPNELSELVSNTKNAWRALGVANFERKDAENKNVIFRRSLYFVKSIRAGEIITREHVRSIRPGYGVSPKYIDDIIGLEAQGNIDYGTPVDWSLVKGGGL